MSTDHRENAKAWFILNAENPSDASQSQSGTPLTYLGLDESLEIIEKELQHTKDRENGCNDNDKTTLTAILGFSQGGVLAHILSQLAQREPDRFGAIRAVMIASGFSAQHVPEPSSRYNTGQLPDREPIHNLPSLHLIGKNDTSVDPSLSLELVQIFDKSEILWHDKGHTVPQKSAECARVVAFLDSCRNTPYR